MMISNIHHEAYVWIWLPGSTEPVVAGKLERDGEDTVFAYGRQYLERQDAIAVYPQELPLKGGVQHPITGLRIPGCIRDCAPDAWGRRVIINRLMGVEKSGVDVVDLSELTYLMESGSDRVGALDFQASPTEYIPRQSRGAALEELLESAERVEKGVPLSPDLDQALFHGSAIGGARPKALIETDNTKYLAKFSTRNDHYDVVKAEFIAMKLAGIVGLNVAPVKLVTASGKDILLVERFDRLRSNEGWQRKIMISALTLFGLDDMMARYASYETLAEIIRTRFSKPEETLHELFSRLVFNILTGNTDDHARNHAAFWDGRSLSLTPAYDICPQGRAGGEASQAMLISGENNLSRLAHCLGVAHHYLLNKEQAHAIIDHQKITIESHWQGVCDVADLSEVGRRYLWRRQFLNPYAFEGLGKDADV
jgi:serine/threonine-protein kinase HipA